MLLMYYLFGHLLNGLLLSDPPHPNLLPITYMALQEVPHHADNIFVGWQLFNWLELMVRRVDQIRIQHWTSRSGGMPWLDLASSWLLISRHLCGISEITL